VEEFYGQLMEDFPIAASEIVKKQSRNPIRNATIAKVEWIYPATPFNPTLLTCHQTMGDSTKSKSPNYARAFPPQFFMELQLAPME
jgi:hypothetical protein